MLINMKKKEKNIDTKIDELARMVASGFTETHKDIGRVEAKVENIEEKVDDIEENYVIKSDLIKLRGDIDIMLDRHIGTFRKDYDDLARRVKDLEKIVLTH